MNEFYTKNKPRTISKRKVIPYSNETIVLYSKERVVPCSNYQNMKVIKLLLKILKTVPQILE